MSANREVSITELAEALSDSAHGALIEAAELILDGFQGEVRLEVYQRGVRRVRIERVRNGKDLAETGARRRNLAGPARKP